MSTPLELRCVFAESWRKRIDKKGTKHYLKFPFEMLGPLDYHMANLKIPRKQVMVFGGYLLFFVYPCLRKNV